MKELPELLFGSGFAQGLSEYEPTALVLIAGSLLFLNWLFWPQKPAMARARTWRQIGRFLFRYTGVATIVIAVMWPVIQCSTEVKVCLILTLAIPLLLAILAGFKMRDALLEAACES